jgi:hypothetical protein
VPTNVAAVHRKTLKYAKYLSGVAVLVSMIVFVMVIIDMAVGFKDKSKYFVGIFVMYVADHARSTVHVCGRA